MSPIPVVDLDMHIVDVDQARWRELLSDPELVPELAADESGVERMVIAGRLYPQPHGAGRGSPLGVAAGGDPAKDALRSEFLDRSGIVRAVLQPGFVGGAALARAEPDVRRPLLCAHNDWVMDVAGSDDRLIAAIAVDPLDPAWSIEELSRCGRASCVRAAVTRPTSYALRPFMNASDSALLRHLIEIEVPLFLHGGTGYYQRSPSAEALCDYRLTKLFSHPTEHMLALADLVESGILDAGLRVVHLEADAGWLPWFCGRLESIGSRSGVALRDLLARSLLVSFNGRADDLHALAPAGGCSVLGFGSDYPHWDSVDIDAARRAVSAELTTVDAEAVLFRNASDLLGLSL